MIFLFCKYEELIETCFNKECANEMLDKASLEGQWGRVDAEDGHIEEASIHSRPFRKQTEVGGPKLALAATVGTKGADAESHEGPGESREPQGLGNVGGPGGKLSRGKMQK